MNLSAFGEKYPFLQNNLGFWEKYLDAKEEVMKLLSFFLDGRGLEQSDFLQHLDEGKPFFAYTSLRLEESALKQLAEAFCKPLGLTAPLITLPETVPLLADLSLEPGEAGFVTAEIHSAIASYVDSVISGDEDAINWLETTCPICGAHAGMGLIAPSGKKNLVCSHCQTVWIYMRAACGLCGNSWSAGTTYYTADEEPNWLVETCGECGYYLKVYDMRNALPQIITYPLFYLTSWNLDLSFRGQGFEPVFFQIFERAGWVNGMNKNGASQPH